MAKLTVLVANRDHYRDMEALDHGISRITPTGW